MVSAQSQASLSGEAAPAGLPHLAEDVFSPEVLQNPYATLERLREAGPLIWLGRYGVAATARHAEVTAILSDPSCFVSSRGVGMADYARTPRFRPSSLLLEADPPEHTRIRSLMNRIVSPRVVRGLRDHFLKVAETIIEDALGDSVLDAVPSLAEAYPLAVFPDAIGMKREERHNLLPVGDLIFNSFGPENELLEQSRARSAEGFAWLEKQARRENLSAEGLGGAIYAMVDEGALQNEEAAVLVRALLQAGLDTTVSAIGGLLGCLANAPDQWRALRNDPALARPAFEEAIRHFSPVQTFFRTVAHRVEFAGTILEPGTKVLMLLAAANRDPRKWDAPDRFEVTRRPIGHVGFGAGIHMCVGQNIARLEAEALVIALAARVSRIEPAGEPAIRLNNTLRSYASLPLRLIPIDANSPSPY